VRFFVVATYGSLCHRRLVADSVHAQNPCALFTSRSRRWALLDPSGFAALQDHVRLPVAIVAWFLIVSDHSASEFFFSSAFRCCSSGDYHDPAGAIFLVASAAFCFAVVSLIKVEALAF